ncbi:MAG: efflux RND transporter periplasmic adaptor subunit [Patescibacteria group bacterium]
MPSRIAAFFRAHKLASGAVVIALAGGGWLLYKRASGQEDAARYVTAEAAKGTLVSSVSGSGAVSTSETIDLKPKASGELTYLALTAGQEVRAGAVIARIDSSDAYQAYKDAQDSLKTAELSLEKLKAPADDFDIRQAEHALDEAREAEAEARDGIKEGYEQGYNAVVDAFLDLPGVMVTLQDSLYDNVLEPVQSNIDYVADTTNRFDAAAYRIRDDVVEAYTDARASYDATYAAYKASSRFAAESEIEKLIDSTYETSNAVSEAVKTAIDFIQYYKDQLSAREMKVPSKATTLIVDLTSALGQANGTASNLLSVRSDLSSDRKALSDASWNITEREEALAVLQEGPDALDVRSQELTIAQRKNAVSSAGQKLADYVVTAPFDGVMASVEAKKGESVSTGTVLGTLVTKQKIAEVTLSEVDVAKVAVGQKATLTFDAVADLTISGQVAEVDALGTSAQGVVNYGVKIAFDTQDDRIKSAMSVTATIIIEAKPGVLLVPASAVKTQNGASYVEILAAGSEGTPERRGVTIGATNDESIEILSGLTEGESVVTRTIMPTAAAATPASASVNVRGLTGGNAGFGGGAGGGGFRPQ